MKSIAKRSLIVIALLFSINSFSQCFDCKRPEFQMSWQNACDLDTLKISVKNQTDIPLDSLKGFRWEIGGELLVEGSNGME